VGWPTGLRANPYAGWTRKISPQILCRTSQPDPLFADQVQSGPTCIVTPKKKVYKQQKMKEKKSN